MQVGVTWPRTGTAQVLPLERPAGAQFAIGDWGAAGDLDRSGGPTVLELPLLVEFIVE